jgi:hypothetical protein
MERRERVGNRRGGDVRGLGICGLGGIHMSFLPGVQSDWPAESVHSCSEE